MRWLWEKAEQPKHNWESFPEQWRGQGQGQGRAQSSSRTKKSEIFRARWAGAGFPATTPAILKVPRALLQVRSGDVPGEAGSGSPVASCLDKHASAAPADCPLHRAPAGRAHSSSLFFLLAAFWLLLPIPAPQRPQQSPGWSVHAKQILGLSASTLVHLTESGCSTKYLPCFEDIPSSRDQNRMLWKGQSMGKDFQLISIIRILFFFNSIIKWISKV